MDLTSVYGSNGTNINIIDFEASSLDLEKSYPIQIGAIKQNGDTFSCYIKPADSWDDWCLKAQEIHNLTPQLLRDVGLTTIEAATQLNEFAKDEILFCDGRQYDQHWLSRLYDEANIEPTFQMFTVHSCIPFEIRYRYGRFKREACERLQLKEHDALNDVKIIQQAVFDAWKFQEELEAFEL